MLAGDGAHRPNLEQAARDLGIQAHVTFTGVVPDPLADALFAASDVVCQAGPPERRLRGRREYRVTNRRAGASHKI